MHIQETLNPKTETDKSFLEQDIIVLQNYYIPFDGSLEIEKTTYSFMTGLITWTKPVEKLISQSSLTAPISWKII